MSSTGSASDTGGSPAAWALRQLPTEQHAAIRAAQATYRGRAAEVDTDVLTRGRASLFSLVNGELAQSGQK